MKLSRYQYCSSLVGLLSATVLLSLSSGNVLADDNTNPPSSHLAVSDHVDEQINTKEVTRTINYVDPLTNEKHTVKGGFELSFYGGLKMYDLGGLGIDRCQTV